MTSKYMVISWFKFTNKYDVVELNDIACEEHIAYGKYIYFTMSGNYVCDSEDQLGRKIGTIYKVKQSATLAPHYAKVEIRS